MNSNGSPFQSLDYYNETTLRRTISIFTSTMSVEWPERSYCSEWHVKRLQPITWDPKVQSTVKYRIDTASHQTWPPGNQFLKPPNFPGSRIHLCIGDNSDPFAGLKIRKPWITSRIMTRKASPARTTGTRESILAHLRRYLSRTIERGYYYIAGSDSPVSLWDEVNQAANSRVQQASPQTAWSSRALPCARSKGWTRMETIVEYVADRESCHALDLLPRVGSDSGCFLSIYVPGPHICLHAELYFHTCFCNPPVLSRNQKTDSLPHHLLG
jgi:hypothetical protein